MRKLFVVMLLLVEAGGAAVAQDMLPLEAYGELPHFDMFVLSPSGKFAATRNTAEGEDLILVLDLERNEYVAAVDASDANPRDLAFVADNRLVLVAGETIRTPWARSTFDYSQAFLFDTESKSVITLLDRAKSLWPLQSGLGDVIGLNAQRRKLYMPAYIESNGGDARMGIYAADMDSKRETILVRGGPHTTDWLVDERGVPIAREDFDDKNNVFRIWTVDAEGKTDRLLYEANTEFPLTGFVGITAKKDALVVHFIDRSSDAGSFFLMSMEDGSISPPIFEGGGLDVRRVISDANRVVYGAEFSGFKPTYAFLDPELHERVNTIQDRLPGVASRLEGWSGDFGRLVFNISGGWSSGVYMMIDSAGGAPRALGHARPAITQGHIAPVTITQYESRDGLTIPALITAREDVLQARPSPTIILPHGGPRAHDDYGFDWLAQFFASRGYVVLQPQFRGSTGFGQSHEDAGDGAWGTGMQFDIDDGTQFLIDQGIADPERICMVGASFGGYAALWAGAFSPDMYRCIAAIAPVSDIPKFLRREKKDSGRDHWGIAYWESLYGADASEKEVLKDISPAEHADAFQAPVLLVHGDEDTIVRVDQSKVMYNALRKAGKDVEFVTIKGEDHWMSNAETRIEMLQAVAEFIEEHL